MKNLRNNPPPLVDKNKSQKICEEFRPDGTLHARQGSDGAGELDRDNVVMARLVAAGRRWPLIDNRKVFVHGETQERAIRHAHIMSHGVEYLGELGRIAVI